MSKSFSNRVFYGSQTSTVAPAEEYTTTCKFCFGAGVDYDFGGPCPKGCGAPVDHVVDAPELAPVVAGPAKTVPATERRSSKEISGLVLERQGNVLTFRVGLGFIKYDVTGGQLRVVDAMDGGFIRPTERAHIVATAKAYAQRAA